MGKTLQEQLQGIRGALKQPENTKQNTVQVTRWVVWRKNGNDYRKVRMSDGAVVEV